MFEIKTLSQNIVALFREPEHGLFLQREIESAGVRDIQQQHRLTTLTWFYRGTSFAILKFCKKLRAISDDIVILLALFHLNVQNRFALNSASITFGMGEGEAGIFMMKHSHYGALGITMGHER